MFNLNFRHFVQAAAVTLALLSSQAHASQLADSGAVYLRYDPVDGVEGTGATTWVHGDDGLFFGSYNYQSITRGVNISYQGDTFWNFSFAAPSYDKVTNTNNGQALQVGLYQNATRFPFNSPTKPGLDVSGGGWGSNTLFGWFNVLEVTYLNGELASLAVDFRQYSEQSSAGGPSLFGSLRFNSSVALNGPAVVPSVPEPATYAMLLAGLVLVGAGARRARGR